jgi:hypothetical protein
MNESLKIGSWVNSYSKGIYRIEKIVDRYYDESEKSILGENKIGDKYNDRIIVSKRLLNSKFKKSISSESCSEYFVSELTSDQKKELGVILAKNPKLLKELDAYETPTETLIYNYNLKIENGSELEKVKELTDFVKDGKTFFEIENEMQRLDILKLKPLNFGNYIMQLFNYDNEFLNRRKIWRDAKLIEN